MGYNALIRKWDNVWEELFDESGYDTDRHNTLTRYLQLLGVSDFHVWRAIDYGGRTLILSLYTCNIEFNMSGRDPRVALPDFLVKLLDNL